MSGVPSSGISLNVRVAEGMDLNINADHLLQGFKNEVTEAISKKLPNIPKLNFDNNSDDSFDKRYEERKLDNRTAVNYQPVVLNEPPNPYLNQNQPM
jgi:hypothetical protein